MDDGRLDQHQRLRLQNLGRVGRRGRLPRPDLRSTTARAFNRHTTGGYARAGSAGHLCRAINNLRRHMLTLWNPTEPLFDRPPALVSPGPGPRPQRHPRLPRLPSSRQTSSLVSPSTRSASPYLQEVLAGVAATRRLPDLLPGGSLHLTPTTLGGATVPQPGLRPQRRALLRVGFSSARTPSGTVPGLRAARARGVGTIGYDNCCLRLHRPSPYTAANYESRPHQAPRSQSEVSPSGPLGQMTFPPITFLIESLSL